MDGGWRVKRVTLEDVCTKASSNLAQKDIEGESGDYPVYGASGRIKGVGFYAQDREYIAVVKDGAGVGRAMFLPAQSSVIGTMQYILPKENIEPKYLYYAVKSMDLSRYAMGATIPHIYFKDYKKECLPLPNRARQQEIVQILDRIENLEKCKAEQGKCLDKLAKSRFVEMFGDPVTNPMGWEVKKLSDICVVGSSKRVYQSEQTTEGVPFLRISDLVSRITSQAESCDLHISEEMFNKFEQQGLVPKAGDILVTARGTLGLCYIIKPDDRFYFQDGMISWVHTSEAEINPVYISYLFDSQGIRRQIDSVIAGSTVAYLSIAQLGKFDILTPPIALQNQFADFVALADKSKLAVQQGIDILQVLKAKLMHDYFG